MVTISHVVGKLIGDVPFLEDALSRGIINNAALAEEMIPEVAKELGKKVEFSAVNMAIRRHAEKISKGRIRKVHFDHDSYVTINSNLFEITVYKTEEIQRCLRSLYDIIDMRKGDFLTITQGLNEIMIISNKMHEKKITSLLAENAVKKKVRSLSSVTLHMPEKAHETIGLFYLVTKALSWNNISIGDIVSTYTEMTFIVDEKDASRAFDVIKGLIKEMP